ncbi:MAG: S1 RNA-binding domain-containing protein, partial [Acidobacteriota bacterium]|nr:S1 RNA-binding domain-containing protein [Acidobacteriota bacterium]
MEVQANSKGTSQEGDAVPVTKAATGAEQGTEEELDFATLLDQYSPAKNLRAGAVVKGKVVKLLEDHVLVHIGFKKEGAISRSEFRPAEDGTPTIAVGDSVEAVIESLADTDDYIPLS